MKHKKHKFIMVIQTLSSVHSTHPHICASQSGYNNSFNKQVCMYIVVLDLMEFILHMINYGHDLNSFHGRNSLQYNCICDTLS